MRLVKAANLTVQFDIQPIRGDRHLDNEGVFPLVGERLTGAIKMTFTATLYATRLFGLGLFFVKLLSCSPNSMLRASSSQRFSNWRKS
jgi:hypothetical protein